MHKGHNQNQIGTDHIYTETVRFSISERVDRIHDIAQYLRNCTAEFIDEFFFQSRFLRGVVVSCIEKLFCF